MLRCEGLSARYGSREVLRGIDLELEPGSLVALVGPNGAGKSSLLRCLAGLLRPSAGRVVLDGLDIQRLDRGSIARRIAVVPQSFETIFPFSVREVVALGRTARLGWLGAAGPADLEAIERAIRELDLGPLADRRVDSLSAGERQRAVLAMALAQEGDVLLLDEPTVHLDPAHQRAIIELVRSLARARGIVALAVLHDLNLAAALCDRVVVLDRGRIAADGPPSRVIVPDVVSDVFGGELEVGELSGVPFVLPRRSSGGRPR